MTVTHTSATMSWTLALAGWLAAARAPGTGAPVLAPGVMDGATGPRDLMARAEACASASLAAVQAASEGGQIWGASAPVCDADTITWGNIIEAGRSDLTDAPNIVLAPSLVIFVTVLALNYLGDVLRGAA